MSQTPAQARASAKYHKKTYEMIGFVVRHDAEINCDVIRAHAEALGEDTSSFVRRAVIEAIQRDNAFSNKE